MSRSVLLRVCMAAAMLVFLGAGAGASEQAGAVGLWRTIDDHSGKPRGLVRIYENNGLLYGRVEKILDPTDARQVCQKCDGDRHGKPILGLEILRGLRPSGPAHWSGGEILDPETGSTYRASATLGEGGRTLVLRGYLLVSLLGRSQTWIRED